MTLDFEGRSEPLEFQAGITRGLGLIVPADVQTLEAVFAAIHHLIQTRGDATRRVRRPRATRPPFVEEVQGAKPTEDSDDDGEVVEIPTTAVVWTFLHGGAWKIRWHDAQGKEFINAKSYIVPQQTRDGATLDVAAYDAATKAAYARACRDWNELDQSDKARMDPRL